MEMKSALQGHTNFDNRYCCSESVYRYVVHPITIARVTQRHINQGKP